MTNLTMYVFCKPTLDCLISSLCPSVARAIECQCYVIAAAQFGQHNAKRRSYGHSLVIDPWGVIIADAGGADGAGSSSDNEPGSVPAQLPSVILCEIDRDKITSVRERMPVQLHRSMAKF